MEAYEIERQGLVDLRFQALADIEAEPVGHLGVTDGGLRAVAKAIVYAAYILAVGRRHER